MQAEAGHLCGGGTGRGSGQADKLAGVGSQNHQGWANGVSQVNVEDRFGAFLSQAGWVKGEFSKETVVPASTFIPRKSCPHSYPFGPFPEAGHFSSSTYVPDGF